MYEDNDVDYYVDEDTIIDNDYFDDCDYSDEEALASVGWGEDESYNGYEY